MEHQIILEAEVEAAEGLGERIESVIRAALEAEQVELPCEISVLLTDDEGIHGINLEMRGVDRPTDVLSFPMFDLEPGVAFADLPEDFVCPLCAAGKDEFVEDDA